MGGTALAAASGVGFGVFQAVNRRALAGTDLYLGTFLQLVVAAAVVFTAAAASGDLGDLPDMPAVPLALFAGAGIVHFLAGWTFLNLSQSRVGAARTSPLLATTPLWGLAIAAIVLRELPDVGSLAAITVILAGVLLVAAPVASDPTGRAADALFGLATAACWAISPVMIRQGLLESDALLLGLAVGVGSALVAFGIVLLLRPPARGFGSMAPDALALKVLAGVLVALATWGRWAAVDTVDIGVVLALSLLSVPVVLALSPLLGRELEPLTLRVLGGSALVVAGSLGLAALG